MSDLFKLDIRDVSKGLVVVVLTAVITAFLKLLDENGLKMGLEDLYTMVQVSLTAGLGYLLKNLLTDDKDRIGGKF